MNDFDAEFEKLREEARRRLDADRELEAKINGPARPSEPDPQIERPRPPALREQRDATFEAAARASRVAKKRVSRVSTAKVAVVVGALIVTLALLNSLIGPLISLAILAGLVLLLVRFIHWFAGGTSAPDDDEDD